MCARPGYADHAKTGQDRADRRFARTKPDAGFSLPPEKFAV